MAATSHRKKKKPRISTPEVRAALDRYKANPLAPDALDHLRTCFVNVEEIKKAKERKRCAKTVLDGVDDVLFGSTFSDLEQIMEHSEAVGNLIREFPDIRELLKQRLNERMEGISDFSDIDVLPTEKDRSTWVYWGMTLSVIALLGIAITIFIKNSNKIFDNLNHIFGRRNSASVCQCRCKSPEQQRITPNDPFVLKAIVQATKPGPLSINQILDVYDFVVSHIEYRNIPNVPGHPPRWPRETLAPVVQYCNKTDSRKCKSVGDCKSMAVVLASMLEGIGAETRLVYVPKHMYVAVRVSSKKNKSHLDKVRRNIKEFMRCRYHTSSTTFPFKISFKTLNVGDKGWELYLLLDPTNGNVPGVVSSTKNLKWCESRPGS